MTETQDRRHRNYDEYIAASWRCSAKDNVPYTEDFPKALLTITEFLDNSLAKGKATRIEVEFDITDPDAGTIRVRDNGVGIENQSDLLRFCTIGSKDSSDGNHRYAKGRICAMASLMENYETAEWDATFRFDGNSTKLNRISNPWSTPEKMQRSMVSIPIDDTNRDIGFEMMIKFIKSILGGDLATNSQKLFDKTKERFITKYAKAIFEKTEFILTVKNATQTITESSKTHNWKTFEQMCSEEPTCEKVFECTIQWESITSTVVEYKLKSNALQTDFPTFGTRCIPAQRVHIVNDGRLIESRHKSRMDGGDPHNSKNGEIVFLNSSSIGGDFNDQPEPATVKVSIVDGCKNLEGIYKMYRDEKKRVEDAEKKMQEKAAAELKKAATELKKAAKLAEAVAASTKKTKAPAAKSIAGGGGAARAITSPSSSQQQTPNVVVATTDTRESETICVSKCELKKLFAKALSSTTPAEIAQCNAEIKQKYGIDLSM